MAKGSYTQLCKWAGRPTAGAGVQKEIGRKEQKRRFKTLKFFFVKSRLRNTVKQWSLADAWYN